MFWEIFTFELKYRVKRPATYAYFAIMLFMCFLFISTDAISIGGSVGMVYKNSPFVIYRTVLIMNIFAALMCSAIMGVPVFRDFDHQIHEIYYTTPVSKRAYWFGRFAGSYVVTVFVLSGMLVGIFLGTLMPWVDAERLTSFNFMAYWQPFVQCILPNVFIMGSIFFVSGALSRSMLVIYIQGIVFLVLYLISNAMLGDVDNSYTAALLDPLGLNSFGYVTRYWTPIEKNTLYIAITSVVGLSRLLWMGIALLIFTAGYRLFSFSATAPVLFARRKKTTLIQTTALPLTPKPLSLFSGKPQYNFAATLTQWWAVTRFELSAIVKSVPFIAIVLLGVFNLVLNLMYANKMYGVQTLPITSTMSEMATTTFSLFMIIILVFYTGELIWRERSVRIDQIADAMPIQQNTLLAGKFTAMVMVLALLQLVVMITAMALQAIKGYYHFDIATYLKALFIRDLWSYVVWVCFAFAVHTLANNKFTGHGIVILLAVLNSIVFRVMGWWHNLYLIGSSPSVTLSEMNGFGHYWKPTFWFGNYWLLFGALMLLIASAFWVRSTETGFGARMQSAKLSFTRSKGLVFAALIGLFVLCGSFIFYNTNILNHYQGKKSSENEQISYEKTYKKYETALQPRIQSVSTDVAIFPDERRLELKGTYQLKNIFAQPIDTLVYILYNNRHLEGVNISISTPLQEVVKDSIMGFYVYKLQKTLLPGDSIALQFAYTVVNKGFENEGGSTDVVYNGTFFNNTYMPLIGYQTDFEMSDPDLRRKYKLPLKPRLYAMADTAQYSNQNYLSGNTADWINYQTTVSTSADQIAIAPGYLQKEWTENNRHYFTYSMDSKILNFYSFLSAKYAVKKDKWNDVNIEIYYHKDHAYNIDKMIDAIKRTLTYCTQQFGPYQHKQVRILEFPRYATFAQSFPNTIPYSEGLGFVLDIDPENDIDMTYYVTSHEVAHQWWGHQVVGAPVQGATVMSESLAQYTALMVMRQQFGKAQMRKFLHYELDRYLRARGREREKELPLILNENQQYIHYQKGSLSMYELQDLLGEETTNTGIRNYLNKYKFTGPPYSNAYQFLDEILAQTPDTLKTNVEDLFTRITLFDNQCKEANYEKTPDGKYLIHLQLSTRKLYADSLGNEQAAASLNEWIDVGALNSKDEVVYTQRIHVTQPDWEISFTLPQLPDKIGIDPYHKLVDRNLDDNLKKPAAK